MNNMRQTITENHPDLELLFLNGFDDAIAGLAISQGNTVVCYSIQHMVNILTMRDKMTDEEAIEFLDHNTLFTYFGEHTPVYLDDYGRTYE